jgi:hypothetical protein
MNNTNQNTTITLTPKEVLLYRCMIAVALIFLVSAVSFVLFDIVHQKQHQNTKATNTTQTTEVKTSDTNP